MKILATYNIKGGVGKTAAAVNLAYLAAREGVRCLVWDLDPQGAATYYFRVQPKIKGGTKKLIRGKRDLEGAIRGTDYPNLDLVPADFSYRHMDIALESAKKPTKRLRQILKPVAPHYDFAFLDCPPSISLVSEAVFRAADVLLVPLIPTTLSLRTLQQLTAFREEQSLTDLILLPFFSMVDRRKSLHRNILETLPNEHPELLVSRIPYASAVERMGVHREPLGAFDRRSSAALAYEALWDEVKRHIA